jgi:CheY-like chemotaxis protein
LEVAALDTLCQSTPIKLDFAGPRGVLVVDDDHSIRHLLDTALRQRGFTVWIASNGKEGLDLYRGHRHEIDLALLDVRMPVLDGPETAAALQELEPALCICFMSGHSGDYSSEQLLELGAVCVFEKPFRLAEVLQTIEQLTERSTVAE